ncbi:MAG: DUF99 family protein [Methanoregulaceae archaeon]|jgi:endonuclease V-like protein UPF0215 family|nr:DUF99 family protein [Methanoregulaceae archaeon]
MHLAKKGLRVLGIAESYTGEDQSVLAGVVMRKDLRTDGLSFSSTTVGGMDATRAVISLYQDFARDDINIIMISGSVISWFNIIDSQRILDDTGKGTVIVTYEDSEGLEEKISQHFPSDRERLQAYQALGPRTPISLSTGYTVYIRSCGLSGSDAEKLCNDFTLDGKVPEPLRVARMCARAVQRFERRVAKPGATGCT